MAQNHLNTILESWFHVRARHFSLRQEFKNHLGPYAFFYKEALKVSTTVKPLNNMVRRVIAKSCLWYWTVSFVLYFRTGSSSVSSGAIFGCGTRIFVIDDTQSFETTKTSEIPYAVVSTKGIEKLGNDSILKRQYSEDDLLHSHSFSEIRLSNQCSVVFFHHESIHLYLSDMLNHLVSQKLVLLDRDVFIFRYQNWDETWDGFVNPIKCPWSILSCWSCDLDN